MIARILEKLADYWREKRRNFLLLAAALLLALISLLVNLRGLAGGGNSAEALAGDIVFLTEKQTELNQLLIQRRQLETPLAAVRSFRNRVWLNERDGDPAFEFRRRIEGAAQKAGIALKSIGPLQRGKVEEGVFTCEITIMANMQYNELFSFLDGLKREGSEPVFWKNLTVAPDNLNSPNFLLVNGTLKIISVTNPEILKLWREEAP